MGDCGPLSCSSPAAGGGGGGCLSALRLAAFLVLPGFGGGLLLAEVAGERRDAVSSAKLLVFLYLVALERLSLMCCLGETAVVKRMVWCSVSRVDGIS